MTPYRAWCIAGDIAGKVTLWVIALLWLSYLATAMVALYYTTLLRGVDNSPNGHHLAPFWWPF